MVGLGLAGLRAAQLLERSGVDVVLFDARPRVGGRLETAYSDGAPSHEAGAQWIDAEHARLISLLAELGHVPWSRPEGEALAIFRGERCFESNLWEDAACDVARVDALAARLCRELPEDLAPSEPLRVLDAAHVAGFLREQSESERGFFWQQSKYRADEGDDLQNVGLLGWLVGFKLYAEREGGEMCALRLPVPASELCERLLTSLAAKPSLGRPLRAVREEGGIALCFDDGVERVDRVVLALPPRCVSALEFDPPLPEPVAAAQRFHRMGRAVKIAFEFDAPFWRDVGWNGDGAWDGPLQQTWDGSIGERHVLCAYACGDDAAAWSRMPDPVSTGLDLLAGAFPEARIAFRRGSVHDWVNAPFTGGVHSLYAPGFVLDHLPHVGRPAGRIHFAGEHTATWSGFMEGALESAERVTAELLEAREEAA